MEILVTDMKEKETKDERLERIVRKVVQDELGNRALQTEKNFVGFILTILFGTSLVMCFQILTMPGGMRFSGEGLIVATLILASVFTFIFAGVLAVVAACVSWIVDKTIYR